MAVARAATRFVRYPFFSALNHACVASQFLFVQTQKTEFSTAVNMATNDFSGNAAKVKHTLSDPIQWEMWYDIVTDRAKDQEIWKYVNLDCKEDELDASTKPERPQSTGNASDVDHVTVEEYPSYDYRTPIYKMQPNHLKSSFLNYRVNLSSFF